MVFPTLSHKANSLYSCSLYSQKPKQILKTWPAFRDFNNRKLRTPKSEMKFELTALRAKLKLKIFLSGLGGIWKVLQLHMRFTQPAFPCVFVPQTLYEAMAVEKILFFNQCRWAEIFSVEDKCFIEFNYVEMFIMSSVYKRRKALSIKSWKWEKFTRFTPELGRNYFIAFSCWCFNWFLFQRYKM